MKSYLLFVLALAGCISLRSQSSSIMQEESQPHAFYGQQNDQFWDSLRTTEGMPVRSVANSLDANICTLNKRVFGWHPYWVGSVYSNYQWNLLSDFCYFDYAVSPTTGNNTNASFAWSTSPAVTAAIANGVKTHICASFAAFESFPNPFTTMLTVTITSLIKTDGILYMTDVNGKVISEQAISIQPGTLLIPMDMPAVSAGVYFINLKSGSQNSSIRVIRE